MVQGKKKQGRLALLKSRTPYPLSPQGSLAVAAIKICWLQSGCTHA
jgi:hypothetical protein